MTTALKLANTFLARHAGGFGLQHMKLQKLCYYAYGWWLSAYDNPLTDKGPEVWKYGPVFSDLYDDLKTWGNAAIVALKLGIFLTSLRPYPTIQNIRVSWIGFGVTTANTPQSSCLK